jgi:hypothetical protein
LIFASNSPRYSNFRAFRVLSEFGNFPSTYYQNTEIFLSRIIRIRKFSFRVLSAYVKFHSAFYLLTLSFSWNEKYILRILCIS